MYRPACLPARLTEEGGDLCTGPPCCAGGDLVRCGAGDGLGPARRPRPGAQILPLSSATRGTRPSCQSSTIVRAPFVLCVGSVYPE
jgi:hypothetical protein